LSVFCASRVRKLTRTSNCTRFVQICCPAASSPRAPDSILLSPLRVRSFFILASSSLHDRSTLLDLLSCISTGTITVPPTIVLTQGHNEIVEQITTASNRSAARADAAGIGTVPSIVDRSFELLLPFRFEGECKFAARSIFSG